MAILDAHMHLGRSHLPLAEARRLLKEAGIAGAAVFADPESRDLPGDNRYALEAAGSGPLLFPFFYVGGNPYSGTRAAGPLPSPSALDGYRGIKWHCAFTPEHDGGGGPLGMSLDEADRAVASPEVAALMARAARDRLPVCLEEHFDLTVRFVARYPDVTFVIPHMGMLNGGTRAVLQAFAGSSNVCFDTSLAVPDAGTIRALGPARILFGSDHPYGDPGSALRRVRGLGLAPDEAAAVLGGNLLRLLGEKEAPSATTHGKDPAP
jgi:hypothetical protein